MKLSYDLSGNINTEESDLWDLYGESRSSWEQRGRYLHHALAHKKIISFLAGIDRSVKVMDIGCGDGFFLNLLAGMGFEDIRGIDPGRPMVERCREKGFSVQRKSIGDLSGTGQFDLVLMIEVLEHLEEPSAAIRNIHSLLHPGGELILTVPVCDSLLKRYHRFRYGTDKLTQVIDWDETHRHAFSASAIRELLRCGGFNIEKCLHASNPYPWIGRYGGKKLSKIFQRLDLGGRFGDILVVLASSIPREHS